MIVYYFFSICQGLWRACGEIKNRGLVLSNLLVAAERPVPRRRSAMTSPACWCATGGFLLTIRKGAGNGATRRDSMSGPCWSRS